MTNSSTCFYAIDHEDGPQFYRLERIHGHRVFCWLLRDVRSADDLESAVEVTFTEDGTIQSYE
jgi:hypothetical protein